MTEPSTTTSAHPDDPTPDLPIEILIQASPDGSQAWIVLAPIAGGDVLEIPITKADAAQLVAGLAEIRLAELSPAVGNARRAGVSSVGRKTPGQAVQSSTRAHRAVDIRMAVRSARRSAGKAHPECEIQNEKAARKRPEALERGRGIKSLGGRAGAARGLCARNRKIEVSSDLQTQQYR